MHVKVCRHVHGLHVHVHGLNHASACLHVYSSCDCMSACLQLHAVAEARPTCLNAGASSTTGSDCCPATIANAANFSKLRGKWPQFRDFSGTRGCDRGSEVALYAREVPTFRVTGQE